MHRGAGEMKGVSMEDNKKQLAALKRLLERPENRACADCSGGGAASRASWASINTGVFICMRCAGPALASLVCNLYSLRVLPDNHMHNCATVCILSTSKSS